MPPVLWTTADGRTLRPREMEDDHLVNVAWHLRDRYGGKKWPEGGKRVLRAVKLEARRRGLDLTRRLVAKVGLVEWAINELLEGFLDGPGARECVAKLFEEAGLRQPMIDVNLKTGRPTYCWWGDGAHQPKAKEPAGVD